MATKDKKHDYRQTVRGVLSLADVREVEDDLRVKIAVARDSRILHSEVFQVEPGQRELEYSLTFETGGRKPAGVKVLAGADVPDEALASSDHHQVWVPAREFRSGTAKRVELKITNKLYLCWRRCCRTYTLRGRVVCRQMVWDPAQQREIVCDAPVRGAEVTAFDVDRFWHWYRRDRVGSDFTDADGNFEIEFRWCCWWWRPWLYDNWVLDPAVVARIKELLARVPFREPIPKPDPVPDFRLFRRLVDSSQPATLTASADAAGFDFVRLGDELVQRLPEARDLRDLRIWPWWPILDCRPDIVFKVTQDCGDGNRTIYTESNAHTRWNVPTEVNGITLVANDAACCGPFCVPDPPDDDCLAIHGVGCGGYPIEVIEQDLASPLVGYARPGTQDRPFGGTIRVLGVFGDGGQVDYYKPQRRRISPAPTGWQDVPEDEIAAFTRGHWLGWPPPLHQFETVKPLPVDGQKVLKTIARYRQENPPVVDTVPPGNGDWLFLWRTADDGANSGTPMPGLTDGVYELRFIGYRFDDATGHLVDERPMPLCPPEGEEVDPAQHAGIRLRLDNRTWSRVAGSVHLDTDEPNCDFPDICAVVVNEDPALPLSQQQERCVDPCGFARVRAGDTITVHFEATDQDGHLEAYSLSAHWAESDVFNVLAAGTLAGDPDALFGPSYAHTFLGAQGAARAVLPVADPEHGRPAWYGGRFKVTVPVNGPVPFNPHRAFETCCAFLLRLDVWKRTTNGCTGSRYFHNNRCEFSFTVIREDLIGHPDHPGCTELCPPDPGGILTAKG